MVDPLSQFVLDAIGSPWLYAAVFALTLADAFLVVVPSETAIVALGALALSTGDPSLAILIPVAATAAVAGDSLTYAIGRSLTTVRFERMRSRGPTAVFAWAQRALELRAATVLLTARFIPFGRIVVNLTAGASGFDYRRFLPLTAVAGSCWAAYNAAVGALIGRLLGGNPILAVAISVLVAIALGALVDVVVTRIAARSASITRRALP